MPYNSKRVGLIISIERNSRDMSQMQLSISAGISRSHLAALESGKKCPSLETVWNIADALSMRPSELLAKIDCTEQRPHHSGP